MTKANQPEYQSLTFFKALSTPWVDQHKLSTAEVKVLSFICDRGTYGEPDMSFAWFPLFGGTEGWAGELGVTVQSLWKTLSRLRSKGLLVNIKHSSQTRYAGVPGYGIPVHVLAECQEMYMSARAVRTPIPDTVEELMILTNGQDCLTNGQDCLTNGQDENALTRGNATHNNPTNQDEREQQPYGSASLRAADHHQEDSMLYGGDDWDLPKEERERPVRGRATGDGWDTPKEVREHKPKKRSAPSVRLGEQFYDRWLTLRKTRRMVSLPWDTEKQFYGVINKLLAQEGMDEQLVSQMIDVFFNQAEAGMVTLRSDVLWKDFLNAKGSLVKKARERVTTTAVDIAAQQAADLERWRARQAEARR